MKFAHPSEKTFSEHLDLFDIEWIYEPVSFPLEWVVVQLKKCLRLIFTYQRLTYL